MNDDAASKWAPADLMAMTALAPLAHRYVPWTAWSMRPAALVTILNELGLARRRTAVELGAGASTVFLARALAAAGGRMVSVEHDAGWARAIGGLLADEGLDDVAQVVHVPLAPWPGSAPGAAPEPAPAGLAAPERWYDAGALLAACPDAIDLLVVDGPPGAAEPGVLARDPAAEVLAPRLADGVSVALDDADRPAERASAERWGRRLGFELTVVGRTALALGRSEGGPLPTL